MAHREERSGGKTSGTLWKIITSPGQKRQRKRVEWKRNNKIAH